MYKNKIIATKFCLFKVKKIKKNKILKNRPRKKFAFYLGVSFSNGKLKNINRREFFCLNYINNLKIN